MIVTKRLTLRAPKMADAPAVTACLQDDTVMRWLTNPPYPYTRKDADAFIQSHVAGTVHFIHDIDGMCGCVSLRDELGYWLAPDRWGRGYMREAARAVIDQRWAASDVAIKSGYIVGNTASQRILSGIGFQATHVEQNFIPALGVDMDVQKMILTRTDWQARA